MTLPTLIALASYAAAVAAQQAGGHRGGLKRFGSWVDAMAALDAVATEAHGRAITAAQTAYEQARTDAMGAIPTALQRAGTDAEAQALAVETAPFGDGRLNDLIDEAKRALERAALTPDPTSALARWRDDYTRRFETVVSGLIGDHATAAANRAPIDLIDPRFLDE